MKKRFITLGLVCLLITGCQAAHETILEATTIALIDSAHEETETHNEERAEDASAPEKLLKVGSSKGNPKGVVLYSSCPFTYGDTDWKLQTLVQEDMLIDGELTMDDRNRFLIQAVSGDASYIFLDEMIQLGVPEADVWVDEQDKLHIVLRDVRTAIYRVTDFVFNPAEKEFIGTDVLDGEGVNFIGTTRK